MSEYTDTEKRILEKLVEFNGIMTYDDIREVLCRGNGYMEREFIMPAVRALIQRGIIDNIYNTVSEEARVAKALPIRKAYIMLPDSWYIKLSIATKTLEWYL
jgi:predicted transcriptional regulator